MTDTLISRLSRLLDAPGPSGFEQAPARVWREQAAFADNLSVDVNGNSYATLAANGGSSSAATGVMLAGHIDEIGVMVIHVDDDGFCWFDPIGGWDPQVLVGQRVSLIGRNGMVPGVIGKQAIHLMDQAAREKLTKPHELWIDIGACSREEALSLISIGTGGVLGSTVTHLPNDRVVSRSLDNRIGACVVLEALRLLAADRPAVPVTAVATTQEEISYTGGGARTSAATLSPQVALVVDVTHATDSPGTEKKRHGDHRLGGGPVLSRGAAVNPVVFDRLVAVAESEGIPYRVHGAPRFTGTDADAIFTSHRGTATGLISVPLRYMHSPNEMVSLDDVAATARLMAAFCRTVAADSDFVPR